MCLLLWQFFAMSRTRLVWRDMEPEWSQSYLARVRQMLQEEHFECLLWLIHGAGSSVEHSPHLSPSQFSSRYSFLHLTLSFPDCHFLFLVSSLLLSFLPFSFCLVSEWVKFEARIQVLITQVLTTWGTVEVSVSCL